jgi:hypothetical protein
MSKQDEKIEQLYAAFTDLQAQLVAHKAIQEPILLGFQQNPEFVATLKEHFHATRAYLLRMDNTKGVFPKKFESAFRAALPEALKREAEAW